MTDIQIHKKYFNIHVYQHILIVEHKAILKSVIQARLRAP